MRRIRRVLFGLTAFGLLGLGIFFSFDGLSLFPQLATDHPSWELGLGWVLVAFGTGGVVLFLLGSE